MHAALIRSVAIGERLRLRREVHPNVKTRNWTFLAAIRSGFLLISFKPQGHILDVFGEHEIDWEEYEKKRDQFNPLGGAK